MSVLSQAVGVVVIILNAIAPHRKAKSSVLLFLLLGNVLTVVQFALLGATTEVAVIAISTIRSLCFFLYSRRDKRAPLWLLAVFIALQCGAVAATWGGPLSLLVLFDVVQTYGQWQTNMKVLRMCTIVASIPLAIYDLLVKGFTGALNQIIQAVSASIALWHKHYRKGRPAA
ncbi:MAG: YgjV family protein [Cellulomonadaceae bacterium]|jgi:hypothetical protein|nr:YgjV family protein [Cellulomonadaceae bacterium]